MAVTSPPGLLKILNEFGRDSVNFSSGSGSTTTPIGTRQVHVEVWGAGGGGGAGTTGNWPYNPSGEPIFGPGGGGGAYATAVIDVDATSTTPITYTVGQGGAGQAQPNEGSSTPRAADGEPSSVTVGATTVTANGGEGAVSWLTQSDPVGSGAFNIFNQEVGTGGSPNGNNGEPGDAGQIGGSGGAALASAYTVNGLSAWFGSSASGAGGTGGTGGSSGQFTSGSAGANGLIIVRYIGNVADNNLTAFYRAGTFVPNASPNTAIATSGNLSIASFNGAALNVVAGSQPNTPTPPQPDPIEPDQVTVTISTTLGTGGTAISTNPGGAVQFTPGGNATINISNFGTSAQAPPTLTSNTCGSTGLIVEQTPGFEWTYTFPVPSSNCALQFRAGEETGGGGNGGIAPNST